MIRFNTPGDFEIYSVYQKRFYTWTYIKQVVEYDGVMYANFVQIVYHDFLYGFCYN